MFESVGRLYVEDYPVVFAEDMAKPFWSEYAEMTSYLPSQQDKINIRGSLFLWNSGSIFPRSSSTTKSGRIDVISICKTTDAKGLSKKYK